MSNSYEVGNSLLKFHHHRTAISQDSARQNIFHARIESFLITDIRNPDMQRSRERRLAAEYGQLFQTVSSQSDYFLSFTICAYPSNIDA